MRRKSIFTVLLVLLLIIIFSFIGILYYNKRYNASSDNTRINSQIQQNTRGSLVHGEKEIFYHFPIIVLSDPILVDSVYRIKTAPFDSLTEDFEMILGSSKSKIPFGTCTYNSKGEITENATWTLTPISSLVKKIKLGDELLVRLSYSKDGTGEYLEYAEHTQKVINDIEHKNPIGLFVPTALCKNLNT